MTCTKGALPNHAERRQMRNFLLTCGCFVLLGAVFPLVDCAAEEAAVGKPAPDITLTGIDGKPFKLSEITSSGKNVALMFSRAHW